jgi:hypothetical protein
MLSQLLSCSDRAKRRDGFIYKSALDWYLEIGASNYAVGNFNRLPYIETKVKKTNGSPTTQFRINFDKMSVRFTYLLQNEQAITTNGFVAG